MSLIDWSYDLSVGRLRLDSDHMILIGLLNQLYDAVSKGQADDGQEDKVFKKVFSTLNEYALAHFSREEALMKDASYPGYVDHKAYHHKLISSLHDFAARYYSDKSSLTTSEVEQFLRGWLTDHIKKADFAYKPYVGSDNFGDC